MNEIREEVQNELADANEQIADALEKMERLEGRDDGSRSMNTQNQSIQSRGNHNDMQTNVSKVLQKVEGIKSQKSINSRKVSKLGGSRYPNKK